MVIKSVEDFAVDNLRRDLRDALITAGEQAILLSMRHPIPDADAERCPRCFAPGTLIRTSEGYRPIEKIEVGDLVLTSDGTFHPVRQLHRSRFKGTAYEWQTHAMTSPVVGTGNHPIFAMTSDHQHNQKAYMRDGVPFCGPSVCEAHHSVATRHGQLRGKSHEIAEVPLEQLDDRSWIVTMVPTRDVDIKQHEGWNLTDDFLWLIGYYIAEGSVGGGRWPRTITFASHRNEQSYRDRVARVASELGFISTEQHQKGDGFVANIYSAKLAKYLKYNVGSVCDKKIIPEPLMQLPAKKLVSLIEGIWCGDGFKTALHETYTSTTWDAPDTKRIGQTSEILALQIAEVVQRLGEQPTIHSTQSKALTPIGNKRKRCYNTGWRSNGKKQVKNRWRFQEEHELVRMKSIRPVEYDGIVYNLGIEDDHTYVVQNTLVHNCYDDIYNAGSGDCSICYSTGFAQPIKAAVKIWTMFTDKLAQEDYTKQGVWQPNQREMQTEAFPLLTEHDYVVRVSRWNANGTPAVIDGFYGIQKVTRDSLRTGSRFGQDTWDVVGQKAVVTQVSDSVSITKMPVVGQSFDRAVIEPVPSRAIPVPVQPDTKVVYVPVIPPCKEDEPITPPTPGVKWRQVFWHTQNAPAATWTIKHPFGYNPSVTLFVDGEEADTDVEYPDPNTAVLVFASPQAGMAELI